jgi:hypothetical protein
MAREIVNEDLAAVDRVISSAESYQRELYTLRRVLGELGKLDIGGIKRGVEAEKARLEEARQKADTAQSNLDELNKQIQVKQRELAGVERTIEERTLVSTQLNEGILGLRSMLAAA